MNVVINYQPNICAKEDLLPLDGVTMSRIATWNCLYVDCDHQVAGSWVTGDWGDCSKSCDNGDAATGKRTRTVDCVDANGNTGDHIVCSEATKPSVKEVCNVGCIISDWQFSYWGVCTQLGDICLEKRQVQCIDSNGQMATACNPSTKPDETQSCTCPDLSSHLEMDLLKDYNQKASHTDYYVNVPDDTLIVRRGG